MDSTADVSQNLWDAFQASYLRWDTLSVLLIELEALREVGFHSTPENAAAFIRHFLKMVKNDRVLREDTYELVS